MDGLFFKPFSKFLERNLRKQRASERHVSCQTSMHELNVFYLYKLLSEAKSCVVVFIVVLTGTRGTAASVVLHDNDLLENWAQICLNTALRQYTYKLSDAETWLLCNVQCTAKTRYEQDETPYEAQAVIIIATMKIISYIFNNSSRGYVGKCAWAIKPFNIGLWAVSGGISGAVELLNDSCYILFLGYLSLL